MRQTSMTNSENIHIRDYVPRIGIRKSKYMIYLLKDLLPYLFVETISKASVCYNIIIIRVHYKNVHHKTFHGILEM